MARTSFTDHQWMLIQPFCLGQKGQPGQTGGDTRLFLEAVLWIARTGAQWRDLLQELRSNPIPFSNAFAAGYWLARLRVFQ
jgi:transposase